MTSVFQIGAVTAAVRATCFVSLVLLTACGGGGGGNSATVDATSPTTGTGVGSNTGGGSSGGSTTPPVVATNTAPVAKAGATQSVVTGATITLDGTTSTDADGDNLTYNWVLTSSPAGSTATLSSSTVAKPTFVANVAGSYVATLVVNDGKISSAAATVTVVAAVANAAPVANAGTTQSVIAGATVTLDGSASSDANNDLLTYLWVLSTRPAGSTAVIGNPTAVRPTFVADVTGTYAATLTVNDGALNSAPATVNVTAALGQVAPQANAGAAQNVNTLTTVTLDGRGSSDANGDVISYSWTLTSAPAGSAAALSDATSAQPTFQPDVAGTYVASLVVSDGTFVSAPSTVTITATVANAAPVANAGAAQTIERGSVVTLSGSASSDANNDPLSYAWTLVSRPSGSSAVLTSTNAVNTSFSADVLGDYVARLVVNDGQVGSTPSTVTITAAGLQLFSTDSFFGESAVTLPFSTTSTQNSNSSCTGSACPTTAQVSSFRFQATGRSYTISNLQAVNESGGSVVPSFSGLVNGQLLPSGQSVPFTLRSSFTGGQTVTLRYSFTIVETAQTFSYRVTLRTN